MATVSSRFGRAQAPPSWTGLAVALLAIPAVPLADTLQKDSARRRRHR